MALAGLVLVLAPVAAGVFFIFSGDGGGTDGGAAVSARADGMLSGPETPPLQPTADTRAPGGVAPGDVFAAPTDKTADRPPGIQPVLAELAGTLSASGPAVAEEFAAERGLRLVDGRVQLVVEAEDPAAASGEITAAGGVIEAAHGKLVQASVPVGELHRLAAAATVEYLRQPETPALAALSEGVADSGANVWHTGGGSGAGVKVAVLDVGFQGYQGLVASGELPADVTAVSFRTDGDITGGGEVHGSACAEVVHDVAPGAQLYLVNFSTEVELANAIDYVIAQDIDVVSASWTFFNKFRGDGQGAINDLVKGAHDAGVFWANVSGNAAQDHWSGTFTDADSDSWHEFAPGDNGNDLNVSAGATIDIYLTWNRWPVTDQDYDMYLVYEGNPTVPVASSDGWQGGTQAPAEQIRYTVPQGKGGRYWVAIRNYSATGDAVFKLYTYPLHLQYQTPAGSLAGQPSDSPDVMSVGAVQVGGTTLEAFSSRGPTVDGRTKPDIVAPDRITTATYGTRGFWGTSAAAPHVAGAGALVLQAQPTSTPDQVRAFLEARATDLGAPGKDNLFGAGKLSLGTAPDLKAPDVTDVQPSGFVNSASVVVSAAFSDAGSGIDPGSVQLTLDGVQLTDCDVTAAGVSCQADGLAGGDHVIGGSVADNAGNTAPINGSFYVACFQPLLGIGSPQPSWATYQDYINRELTIDFSLCNVGAYDSYDVGVVGSKSTNGVILASVLPLVAGDLPHEGQPGACATLTLRYIVPHGVESFKTVTYVEALGPCGAAYYYPGPFIGPGG